MSPYYPSAIRFESEIEPAFETHVYGPLREWIFGVARRMRAIQAGSIHAYLAYIFVTLIAAPALRGEAVMIVFTALLQFVLLLALAPLVTGVIRTLKARLQIRRGPGILQPYQDMLKLFRKGMVTPGNRVVDFRGDAVRRLLRHCDRGPDGPDDLRPGAIELSSAACSRWSISSDSAASFWRSAAWIPGSSFGGLGSSREMTIAALAEPAMMLAVFTVAIGANSTSLTEIARAASGGSWHFLAPAQMLACAALFLVLIAETGRIPVDNPATHLELTMIHEAMILEYSGPYLGLIEWGASIKQLLLMTLLINCFLPFGLHAEWSFLGAAAGIGWLVLKLLVLACSIVLVETTNAKMRLFRVPELLAVAFTLAALALISTFLF